jgi:hypothetical protein
MGKPMSNAKSVRTPMLPELSDDNKRSLLLPQVRANNRLTPDKSMTTPVNKHLRHLRLLSSNVMMIHLVPTAYVQETSLGTLNETASKFTTPCKPTWEPLLPPQLTSKILQWYSSSQCDRGGVPDLSVSRDKSDLVVVDPHDPTTTSKPEAPMQSLNQLPVVIDLVGARSA